MDVVTKVGHSGFFHMRIWIRIMSMMRMQPNTSKIEKSYYSDKSALEYSKIWNPNVWQIWQTFTICSANMASFWYKQG